MAFVGERLAARNANRGENAPSAEQPGLARRETHLLDGRYAVVMKNVPMDQLAFSNGAADRLYCSRKIDSVAQGSWRDRSDRKEDRLPVIGNGKSNESGL